MPVDWNAYCTATSYRPAFSEPTDSASCYENEASFHNQQTFFDEDDHKTRSYQSKKIPGGLKKWYAIEQTGHLIGAHESEFRWKGSIASNDEEPRTVCHRITD